MNYLLPTEQRTSALSSNPIQASVSGLESLVETGLVATEQKTPFHVPSQYDNGRNSGFVLMEGLLLATGFVLSGSIGLLAGYGYGHLNEPKATEFIIRGCPQLLLGPGMGAFAGSGSNGWKGAATVGGIYAAIEAAAFGVGYCIGHFTK